MQPGDPDAAAELARQQWAAFVATLADHLAAQWPAMPERLGERYAAFVEHGVQQAGKRGLATAAAVARYVNLWFVWGPAFHDKPGFEWAQGLLAAPADREWLTVHQLVQRSIAELKRLPDARIGPEQLAAADARLVDRFGALGRQGELHPAEPPPRPRHACDLEAFELRLVEPAVAEHHVRAAGGGWGREPIPLPPPLRVDLAHPLPRLVAALSHAPGGARPARMQLRAVPHAQCDTAVHPALRVAGTHGLWSWTGHETRAVSWPLHALQQPVQGGVPGSAIAEETSPDIFRLELATCGLRDEGDALGPQSTQLWVWPAEQWWLQVERRAAEVQPVVAGRAPVLAPATRCSVEVDGQPRDAAPLQRTFAQGLDAASAAALQALLAALTQAAGVSAARLDGQLALLTGQAAFTWGWRLGAGGLDGRAFMRLLAQLDMAACQAELHAESELTVAGARARLALHLAGRTPLVLAIAREAAEPPLLAAMLPARTSIRLPFAAELTPIADDSAVLMRLAAPLSAALVGEAGLRPRTRGGSGFEWFAQLRLEPAALTLVLHEPGAGVQTLQHALWPAQTLLDWSTSA
jgi:hypothetical protein